MKTQKRFTVYVMKTDTGSSIFSRMKQAQKVGVILDELGVKYTIEKQIREATVVYSDVPVDAADCDDEVEELPE